MARMKISAQRKVFNLINESTGKYDTSRWLESLKPLNERRLQASRNSEKAMCILLAVYRSIFIGML
jgi:hypothetical protein